LNESQEVTETEPGGPPRKGAAQRRAEFTDIAIRLFSERPYGKVSIDEIAAEAGVAKGLLYYYFGDKQGLYVAGLQRLAREMHAQIAAAADSSATPIERLMLALDAHLAFIEQYPAGYRELLSSSMSHPEVRTIMESERTAFLEMVLSGLPPEAPRGPAVTLAVKGWQSFVEGAALAWLADRGIDRAHLSELCSRVLYGAILAAIEIDKKTQEDPQGTRDPE
jgi:AcrR family transcriptional regulator